MSSLSPLRRLSLFALLLSLAAVKAWADPFSHRDWQKVLDEFVGDGGLVDYHGLHRQRQVLDRYVRSLATLSPETEPALFPTPDHELAYYLNAYNAFVFIGVLELGPKVESVWGKSGVGLRFFVRRKYSLGGRRINLRRLENEIIRERFKDPRIHAALVCASLGCPRLARTAFSGPELSSQLDEALSEWLSSETAVRVDWARSKVELSKIFDWFRRDFLETEVHGEGSSPSLIGYLNRHRDDEGAIPLSFEISFLPYDKRLNRQP